MQLDLIDNWFDPREFQDFLYLCQTEVGDSNMLCLALIYQLLKHLPAECPGVGLEAYADLILC